MQLRPDIRREHSEPGQRPVFYIGVRITATLDELGKWIAKAWHKLRRR